MSPKESKWRERFQYIKSRMARKKKIDEKDMKTELRRCLSTVQLTFLGIGNTIGVGIYVLLGEIAKEQAGPAVIVCFMLAILVTLMNALVYAELSANVPQTGASYTFFYKIFGEYVAFLCGWTMFVTYVLSASAGARAWSGMLDSFFNNSIQGYTTSVIGTVQLGLPFATHLDVVACLFQLAVMLIVTCNVQCSSVINTALSVVTTSVLVFVCVAGLIFGDVSNFLNSDHGGFAPFGLSGVVKGVSLAIYAASGFEIISISAEEAKNPAKSVPRAIVAELLFVGLVYMGAAAGMLFLIPYWLIDLRSPLSSAFEHGGLVWGKYVVTIGPLFGITNLQMLGLYGCSRVFYRMASDNLFFTIFLKVNSRTGTPMNSIFMAGSLTSVFALLFDLSSLVEFTVSLMLISSATLGSALIKLKVTESVDYLRQDGALTNPAVDDVEDDVIEFERPYKIVEGKASKGEMSTSPLCTDLPADVISKEGGAIEMQAFEGRINDEDGLYVPDLTLDQNSHPVVENHDSIDNEDTAVCQLASDEQRRSRENLLPLRLKGSVTTQSTSSQSLRARLWASIAPFMPKLLSANVLIMTHWLSCMTLSAQVVNGWHDISTLHPVAVTALVCLLLLLLVIMFLLWLQRTKRVSNSFQTPMMPLIPTLANVGTGVLFFSAISLTSVVVLIILVLLGTVFYFLIIWSDVQAQVAMKGMGEEMRSLVDNEDESEEEMNSPLHHKDESDEEL